jgi:hypothetical protein
VLRDFIVRDLFRYKSPEVVKANLLVTHNKLLNQLELVEWWWSSYGGNNFLCTASNTSSYCAPVPAPSTKAPMALIIGIVAGVVVLVIILVIVIACICRMNGQKKAQQDRNRKKPSDHVRDNGMNVIIMPTFSVNYGFVLPCWAHLATNQLGIEQLYINYVKDLMNFSR